MANVGCYKEAVKAGEELTRALGVVVTHLRRTFGVPAGRRQKNS